MYEVDGTSDPFRPLRSRNDLPEGLELRELPARLKNHVTYVEATAVGGVTAEMARDRAATFLANLVPPGKVLVWG